MEGEDANAVEQKEKRGRGPRKNMSPSDLSKQTDVTSA